MCGRSLLFSSQMLSIRSVSGTSRHASCTSHGFVYAAGSSIVTLMLMRPMFGLVNRSTTRSDSVAGQAPHVEPRLAVLPDRLDDERIAFPVADGVPHPGRLGVLRQRAAVGEDLPVDRSRLVQEDHHVRSLHDLEAVRDVVLLGDARGPAAHAGMILAVVLDPFLVERLRPRLQRHLARLQICGEVQQMLDGLDRHPESGEIGLAVSGPARRRVHVDLAVRRPRHVLPRVRIPLRVERRSSPCRGRARPSRRRVFMGEF